MPNEFRDDEEFFRWYGDWAPLTPATVGEVMAGFDRPWWVVGGWSVEAATGVSRAHDDLDVSLLARDVPAFAAFLGERWTAWNNAGGVLRPLRPEWPPVEPDSQLWVRRDSRSPWVLDVPITPDRDGLWTNKRLPEHVAPVEEVTWVAADGVRYLRPEVAVMMKARLDRPKDRADLDAVLPVLDDDRRAWLFDTVERAHPGHPWLRHR
ncbi:hypothetical protein GCM10023340_37450 [Nocardioides marinquilinus]|uniref:Amino acid transporter n=1 Tax=Nocardioides marinquilinus TaxID=1210400 RepID=A0ABP9Q1A0_9ACTN